MSVLIARLSSLGDVVLAGAITPSIGGVTFLTRPRYAPVAAALRGVERVVVHGRDPLPTGIKKTIDLQGDLRTRLLCVRLGAPARHVVRHDLRRRMRVWLKLGEPPPRVIDRYAAAAGVALAPLPWLRLPRDPEPDALLLLPGAAWATKRWSIDRWIAVGQAWDGPVTVLGGPDEAPLVAEISAAVGGTALAEDGFTRTLAALPGARAAVGGDTGLLHLAAAAGVPVVGLFGTTTSADGFWCHDGVALEHPLSCRPCSRHGRATCPIGDHRCMTAITPDDVAAALERIA